jgi:antitoxin component YwqK of YwqJK toxin-antitoxin module
MVLKNNIIILAFLSALLLSACSENKKQYWDNGKLQSELNYKNGKLDGPSTWYFENGRKEQEVFYKNNKLDGFQNRWYPSGTLESRSFYKDGKLEGTALTFDEDGNKATEETYTNDTLDGIFNQWYSSGQLKIHGQYDKGYFDGQWVYHDIYGNVIGVGNYEKGSGTQKAWYPNGVLQREISYVKNVKHGAEKWYDTDGKLEKVIFYADGNVVE